LRGVVLILAGLAAAAAAAAPVRPATTPAAAPAGFIGEARAAARPGDVLFKAEPMFWARLAARFNADAEGFGHVGLVAEGADGALIVIHAGGDPARADGRVQATDFGVFLRAATDAALYRPRTDEEGLGRAIAYAAARQAEETPFDRRFSLATANRLYCTELIWRALALAVGEDPVPVKTVRGGDQFIALDDLAQSPHLSPAWASSSAAAHLSI
jgi:hypothetical protein